MLGYKKDTTKPQTKVKLFNANATLPDSIDWVAAGKVSQVKDQGSCGSCWTFSTTGSIESAVKIKEDRDIILSEQQIIDCSVSYGNNGCSGGLVEYAYHYLTEHELETEAQYPYKASNHKCTAKAQSGDIELTDFSEVARFDPVQLAQALQKGPVSVGVDASDWGIRYYKSGIITKNCGTSIDHAVLLVGYGTDNGVDYWTIKNSWGADWGEKGYFRILRDMTKKDDGMCGVQSTPCYPIL